MASISTDKRGNRTIQFVAGDKLRRSIRLGKLPSKAANTIKGRVEALNAAAIAKISIDRETAEWVGRLDATLHGKLAAVGLVPKREEITLAAFLDAYRAERGDLKPSTRTNHRQAADNLLACFGAIQADPIVLDRLDRRRPLSPVSFGAGVRREHHPQAMPDCQAVFQARQTPQIAGRESILWSLSGRCVPTGRSSTSYRPMRPPGWWRLARMLNGDCCSP